MQDELDHDQKGQGKGLLAANLSIEVTRLLLLTAVGSYCSTCGVTQSTLFGCRVRR